MTHNHDLPNSQTVVRRTLDNGITVLVYENPHVHSVVVAGSLMAGGIYVSPEKSGLASMVASSLMLSTQTRDFDTINSSLEDIGADLHFNAGGHKVGFSGKALAEDLPLLIDILSDALRNPTFPADHVERRQGEALTWLQYQEQDTRWQSAHAFRGLLYPTNHPYHYSVRGTLKTVPHLTAVDLQEYHRTHYAPDGMVIVIVGAINADSAIGLVENHLGDWRNDQRPPAPDFPSLDIRTEMIRKDVVLPDKAQNDILIGTVGPSRYAPDYQAANLANSILGQFGMMGRIGMVIREEAGLAYYAYSRIEGGYGPGAWLISAGVDPHDVEETIDMAITEIQRIVTEVVSDEDLTDNQAYFSGRLPLQLESSEGIAGTLLTIENFDLGLDYLLTYRDMIYSLTKDDLLEATQNYLTPDALVITTAGSGA